MIGRCDPYNETLLYTIVRLIRPIFQCLLLDADPLDKTSPWAFFPILLAAIGIFYTFSVVLVFIVFNRTSIIMASGRELSFVLLGGIITSYASTFALLAQPNEVNCVRKF